jgi:acyl-coenzyme A thioesterase PaaI-like protein
MSVEESMPDLESEPPGFVPEPIEGLAALGVATHRRIEPGLCGRVTHREAGAATVILATTAEMGADDHGLVHGGFVFGAADYAAMVAVNDPNVVLGAAETRFVAPVRVGDTVVCSASIEVEKGRKRVVRVVCEVGGKCVMEGVFTTFVLERHVLDSGD